MSVEKSLRRAALLLLTVGFGALLSGCAPVKPWQRDYIARDDMKFDPDPLEARSRQHLYSSKEAASGGYGVGGGGCGCN